METAEVVALLRKAQNEDSLRVFARKIGVSGQYVWDVLRGARTPGPKILTFLGLEGERVIQRTYRRKRNGRKS